LSIEYIVYPEEKKENRRLVSWLVPNRRTGVHRFHEGKPACLWITKEGHRFRFQFLVLIV